MVELGFFRGERLELIHGSLLRLPPIGPPHASVVSRLNRLLLPRLVDRADVRIQPAARRARRLGAGAGRRDRSARRLLPVAPRSRTSCHRGRRLVESISTARRRGLSTRRRTVDEYWIGRSRCEDDRGVHRALEGALRARAYRARGGACEAWRVSGDRGRRRRSAGCGLRRRRSRAFDLCDPCRARPPPSSPSSFSPAPFLPPQHLRRRVRARRRRPLRATPPCPPPTPRPSPTRRAPLCPTHPPRGPPCSRSPTARPPVSTIRPVPPLPPTISFAPPMTRASLPSTASASPTATGRAATSRAPAPVSRATRLSGGLWWQLR